MSENRKRILQMLAEGKISVDEAQSLLSAIGGEQAPAGKSSTASAVSPKYLYVVVEPKPGASMQHQHGRVNVRVPIGLIRAGMKLAALIPPEAADKVDSALKEKGFSFDVRRIKDEDIEELISALQDSEINVESDEETVRVRAE